MDLRKLAFQLDQICTKSIYNHFPHLWDEDTITNSIVSNMYKVFNNQKIDFFGRRFDVSTQIYKNKGRREQDLGDVAFLIDKVDGYFGSIRGAAFFEGKVRKWHSVNFPEIKIPQMRRILSVTSRSYLFLYDYEYISLPNPLEQPLRYEEFWERNYPKSVRRPYIVPMSTALATGFKDTRLTGYGIPCSQQIVERFLFGTDLDHNDAVIKRVQGWRKDKGIPKRVVHMKISEPEFDVEEPAKFNENVFEIQQ